jgi:hypothetical protein
MVERDLGQATIVYEDRDGEPEEKTVQNEHIAYFQDHWIVKTGEHERGHDVVRRIPAQRVYHVERSVEQFEQEIQTIRDQVQSVAEDLRTKILGGGSSSGGRTSGIRTRGSSEGRRVEVEESPPEGGGSQNR